MKFSLQKNSLANQLAFRVIEVVNGENPGESGHFPSLQTGLEFPRFFDDAAAAGGVSRGVDFAPPSTPLGIAVHLGGGFVSVETAETVGPKRVGVVDHRHTQGVPLETADERLGGVWREKKGKWGTCDMEDLEGEEEVRGTRVDGVGVSRGDVDVR